MGSPHNLRHFARFARQERSQKKPHKPHEATAVDANSQIPERVSLDDSVQSPSCFFAFALALPSLFAFVVSLFRCFAVSHHARPRPLAGNSADPNGTESVVLRCVTLCQPGSQAVSQAISLTCLHASWEHSGQNACHVSPLDCVFALRGVKGLSVQLSSAARPMILKCFQLTGFVSRAHDSPRNQPDN